MKWQENHSICYAFSKRYPVWIPMFRISYRRARRRALWPGVATPPLGATWTKKTVVAVVVVGGVAAAAAVVVFLAAAAVGWCGGSP